MPRGREQGSKSFHDNTMNPQGKKDLPKEPSRQANQELLDAIGKNVSGGKLPGEEPKFDETN